VEVEESNVVVDLFNYMLHAIGDVLSLFLLRERLVGSSTIDEAVLHTALDIPHTGRTDEGMEVHTLLGDLITKAVAVLRGPFDTEVSIKETIVHGGFS
jgi:hypothetical protein